MAEAGKVTDEWFYEVIVQPARDRGRRKRRSREANRLPTREEYVTAGVTLGGSREQLEAGYDRWAAAQTGGTDGSAEEHR